MFKYNMGGGGMSTGNFANDCVNLLSIFVKHLLAIHEGVWYPKYNYRYGVTDMSIKDVARAAGVSAATVSRVVNSGDNSAASAETRQRIWNAVREQGYVINQNARSLKRPGHAKAEAGRDIDCVFARVAGLHVDPFFTLLMHEVEVEALNHRYHLRYQYSLADFDNQQLPHRGADSAIILGRVTEDAITRLRKTYRHVICAGLQERDFVVDQVLCSGFSAAETCVHYLHSLGHSRICYLGETELEQRYDGYVHAMRDIGVTDVQELTLEASFSPVGGHEAVQALIDRGTEFTAIFCANDMLAVGALKALRERRLRVPRDVSLIGINDMETVRYLDPMLTTVAIPLDEMGKIAGMLLIDRIEGGHRKPVKAILPHQLIVRESCGPAPKK